MVSDVSHDRLFGEENAGSWELSPWIASAGDLLVMVPYLVIGAALWSISGSTTPRTTNRSGFFLVWVSSWADPIRK